MSAGKWRPNCHVCGRFIGVGGYYDVIDNEEGYSTCYWHTDYVPASIETQRKPDNPPRGEKGAKQ
jgi:hypothetical protein